MFLSLFFFVMLFFVFMLFVLLLIFLFVLLLFLFLKVIDMTFCTHNTKAHLLLVFIQREFFI